MGNTLSPQSRYPHIFSYRTIVIEVLFNVSVFDFLPVHILTLGPGYHRFVGSRVCFVFQPWVKTCLIVKLKVFCATDLEAQREELVPGSSGGEWMRSDISS